MKKILFLILTFTACLLFLTGCSKQLASETNIDKILKNATVLMCTDSNGTILYSLENDEDETIDIDIPQDAILYLVTNDWNNSYGVWDMKKGTWVLGPAESRISFHKTDSQLLSFDFDGEEYNTNFQPITDEERAEINTILFPNSVVGTSTDENKDTVKDQSTDSDTSGETTVPNSSINTDTNSDGNGNQADNNSATSDTSSESTPPAAVVLPEKPTSSNSNLSAAEARDLFWSQTYGDMSYAEIEQRLMERHSYAMQSSYTRAVSYFWEDVLGVTDVGNRIEPMFYSDLIYYDAEDFSQANAAVLKVAKNEIYARHGYIFKNQDLQNYFMGCTWYEPKYTSDQFDSSVFNECEAYNLKLITALSE